MRKSGDRANVFVKVEARRNRFSQFLLLWSPELQKLSSLFTEVPRQITMGTTVEMHELVKRAQDSLRGVCLDLLAPLSARWSCAEQRLPCCCVVCRSPPRSACRYALGNPLQIAWSASCLAAECLAAPPTSVDPPACASSLAPAKRPTPAFCSGSAERRDAVGARATIARSPV